MQSIPSQADLRTFDEKGDLHHEKKTYPRRAVSYATNHDNFWYLNFQHILRTQRELSHERYQSSAV